MFGMVGVWLAGISGINIKGMFPTKKRPTVPVVTGLTEKI
jgi:hypothetical protein